MSKFKIGDQVKLVKYLDHPLNQVEIGDVGIITFVYAGKNKTWPYVVKFEGRETGFKEEELELTKLSNSPLWKALK